MTRDKYGTGQDPYCYPGTRVLRNRLDLRSDDALAHAERELTAVAAAGIDFMPPPYTLSTLCDVHRRLFADIYEWAGQLRTVDIAKGNTRFCHVGRIEAEAAKLFDRLAQAGWFTEMGRCALVVACAELYGDLNVVHPFREGNGRAQRMLFEHMIVNAGYQIDWWATGPDEWIQANVDAVVCDYRLLTTVFERCIGQPVAG